MITKESLEETIRGVIREFKRTKRITEPAANELTAALEERVDDLFDQEATFSYKETEDSAGYVSELRDNAQSESAETFLTGDRSVAANAFLIDADIFIDLHQRHSSRLCSS